MASLTANSTSCSVMCTQDQPLPGSGVVHGPQRLRNPRCPETVSSNPSHIHSPGVRGCKGKREGGTAATISPRLRPRTIPTIALTPQCPRRHIRPHQARHADHSACLVCEVPSNADAMVRYETDMAPQRRQTNPLVLAVTCSHYERTKSVCLAKPSQDGKKLHQDLINPAKHGAKALASGAI